MVDSFTLFCVVVATVYDAQMWHFQLRGLVFDLQTVCDLPRLPTLAPSVLLSTSHKLAYAAQCHGSGSLIGPSSALLAVLHSTLLPLVEVYMGIHPSRTRMEQYRVDVGHLCMGALSLLPFACLDRPLEPRCAQMIDAILEALEALVSALALMAGPATVVLAFAADLDRDSVTFAPHGAVR